MKKGGEVLPDHLRCKRTDGRQWRCKRPVKDDKKLCEIHYIQGKMRQNKEKVPDSLRLDRKPGKSKTLESAIQTRAPIQTRAQIKLEPDIVTESPNLKKSKRKLSIGASEALDETLKKMKLKKGDLHLELIRGFLKRQVEKTKEKQLLRNSASELTKKLPNGLMAISPSPLPSLHILNNAGSCNVKLGIPSENSPLERCFRSKNIEPLPIGTMQILPSVAKLKKAKKKSCHWCRKSCYRILIKCSSCLKHLFCGDCIQERQFSNFEVQEKCPVCRGICSCRACSANRSNDKHKDHIEDRKKIEKIRHMYYLIQMLLPTLKQINLEHNVELGIDAKCSEAELQIDELGFKKLYYCNNCRTSILDIHRSCTKCSYSLCLNCCSELRSGCLTIFTNASKNHTPAPKKKPIFTSNFSKNLTWKAFADGSIACPPFTLGGCADSVLELKCLFPLNRAKELEIIAEDLLKSYIKVTSDHRVTDRIKKMQEAAKRESSYDNLLYHPTLQDLQNENIRHFQKHWVNGQPVIVQKVCQSSADFNWDPIVLFCTFLEKNNAKPLDVRTGSCLDWCEVEFSSRKIYMGSLEGRTHANLFSEAMKLRCWLSSLKFQEQFPAHYAEIIRNIPFQEYINPVSGILNLAVNLPETCVGPSIYISYGGSEELMQSDFITRLSYDPYDVVNILAHTTDIIASKEQMVKIKSSLKKKKGKGNPPPVQNIMNDQAINLPNGIANVRSNSGESQIVHANECGSEFNTEVSILCSGEIPNYKDSDEDENIFHKNNERRNQGGNSSGAHWDIFRREDVPNLLKYLRKYSNELSQPYAAHVVHPILDQTFFLDSFHKLKLKEEFNIEPWTFEQRTGEAVIVPAGCPYQVRKLKSCVNVIINFISPESASESIKLTDEIRLLPLHHKAREKLLEVKKRSLDCISDAINEIRK